MQLPAVGTVEVIWMVRIILEDERLFINNSMALLANVFPQAPCFFPVVTRAAKMSKNSRKGKKKTSISK